MQVKSRKIVYPIADFARFSSVQPTRRVGELCTSVGKTKADDAPQGLDAVFPGDLFAFFIGTAGIRNGDFVNPPVAFCDFGGDFRFKPEAVGFQLDSLQDFAAENLVAGFHVRELEVGEDVGEKSEHLVGNVVPEIVDALRPAKKSRAEDDVGAAVDDGFKKLVVVARIVFEVGILDENDVAGDFGKATAESGALALIVSLKKDAEVAELDGIAAIESGSLGFAGGLELAELFEDLTSAVGGTVVDEDYFLPHRSVYDASEDFVNGGFFVVDRNDHGKLRVDHCRRVAAMRGHSLREKFSDGTEGK
jgi:hypothetical protein